MTVKPLNLTLYLVLDPDLCSQSVGIIETALAAVQAGAGIVQLRAPTWKKRRMTECARALKSALTPFHVPLIIDDHADVMLAANADGLHVGQQDLTPADARQLIGSNRILGLSLGSLEDCAPMNSPLWTTSASDRLSLRNPNRMRARPLVSPHCSLSLPRRRSLQWPSAAFTLTMLRKSAQLALTALLLFQLFVVSQIPMQLPSVS